MEASGSSVYLQTKTSYVAAVNIFSPDAFSRAQTCDSIDSQLCTDSASDSDAAKPAASGRNLGIRNDLFT